MEEKIICNRCNEEFVFTERDQEFYLSKRYNKPKKCKKCRQSLKAKKGLVEGFRNSIIQDSISITSDMMEIGLDSILNESVLREIPIVGTAISLGKVGMAIKDRKLIKNTIIFLNEFNSGIINPKKLEKYRKRLSNDKKLQKEVENLFLYLDAFIEERKVKIISRLYCFYINEEFTYNMLLDMYQIIRMMKFTDINVILNNYKCLNENDSFIALHQNQFQTFSSLGLLKFYDINTVDPIQWLPGSRLLHHIFKAISK